MEIRENEESSVHEVAVAIAAAFLLYPLYIMGPDAPNDDHLSDRSFSYFSRGGILYKFLSIVRGESMSAYICLCLSVRLCLCENEPFQA